jgi:hypothetical protein
MILKQALNLLLAVLLLAAGNAFAADDAVRDGDIGIWETLEWSELSPVEQGLWQTLGWSEASWNEEADPPASESKGWAELSEPEQEAAQSLGFEQESWDD